jgi:hypothetical protein
MSHQPFETWLLSDEPLDEEKRKDLEAHLNKCESCRELSTALENIRETFTDDITPAPQPGFVYRWHQRLSVARQQRQQRKMWLLTLGLFGVAGLILLSIFLLNMNSINWFYEFGQAFANFSRFANRINQFVNIIKSLTNQFPILIPIMIIFGVGSITAQIALIVTWISSMVRLYRPSHEGVTVR